MPPPLTPEQRSLAAEHIGLIARESRGVGGGIGFVEERQSAGHVALCEAARTFDPARGVRFATYAGRAIVRRMGREIGTSARAFVRERPCGSEVKAVRSRERCPVERAAFREMAGMVATALATLPARTRRIVRLRSEGRSLREVAAVVQLTAERVRQIEARAYEQLRSKLPAQ
jgi:RNA polymerase sigma factor (sigma-70 family)